MYLLKTIILVNPQIASNNAIAVKICNATSSLVRFENKKYFLLHTFEKRKLPSVTYFKWTIIVVHMYKVLFI
jgi:hypothetical protein